MTDLKVTIAQQDSLGQATRGFENRMQATSILVKSAGSSYNQVIIAAQAVDGTVDLLLTTVPTTAENAQCMRKVRKEYNHTICKQRMSLWRSMFTKSIVGTARVQEVGPTLRDYISNTLNIPKQSISTNQKLPAQHLSGVGLLYHFIYDEVLNYYWHNPSSLTRRKLRTVDGHSLVFNILDRQDILGKRVIVVRQVVSKMKVALMLFVLLVLGGIVGIVIGLMTSRADIAIATSAGSFAFVAVVQSLVAWLSI